MIWFPHGLNGSSGDRVPEGPTSFGWGGGDAVSRVGGELCLEAVGVANLCAARVLCGLP
jgi:hypothetical protein